MNVILPKQYHVSKKDIIIYTIVIVVCVVALTLIITMQFLGEGIFSKKKIHTATEEEQSMLRTQFDNMFVNQFIGEIQNVSKKQEDKNIVFTNYQNQDSIGKNYTLDVNIPEINIENEVINEINDKISKKYKQQVGQIMNTNGNQTIYSVEYVSYVENNILFLIIRSNLKKGNSAQQTSIDTYNYDLESKKQINLEEMIEKLQYNQTEVQNKIIEEIKREEENAKNLQELGYSIYIRDSQSDMYKIQNSEQFFIRNGRLYIVYSYGNESLTSEIDFIIL